AFNNSAYPGSLGPGYEGFGTVIDSDQPIIVERPFYINREFPGICFVNAATDEHGALSKNETTRLFAEGTMLPDFFEFLTFFNPNDTPARARLDYFVQETGVVTNFRDIPANSRATVVAYDRNNEGSLAQALGVTPPSNIDFGMRAASVDANGVPDNSTPIVVERPMYVNAVIASQPPAINDGHDTLGFQFPAGEVPCLPSQTNCQAAGPAIQLTKADSSDPVSTGQEVTYTLTAVNTGNTTLTG